MKFQSNFEDYKNDLAKDLKEKRSESREDAQNFLAVEKETDKYKLSRNIKIVRNEIDKNKNDEIIEKIEVEPVGINIEEIDINNQIPEDIKMQLDELRLHSYDKNFEHPNAKKSGLVNFATNKEVKRRIVNIIDLMVEGNFLSQERFNTVINAWGGNSDAKRWLYDRKDDDFNEHQYFAPSDEVTSPLWFAANGSDFYFDLQQTIVIVNPFSKRFRENTKSVAKFKANKYGDRAKPEQLINLEELKNSTKSESEINSLLEKNIKKSLNFAKIHKEEGICISFNNVRWYDIADWIINISTGKLYKITSDDDEEDKSNRESWLQGIHP